MKPYLWVRRSAKNIWIFSEEDQEGLGWFPLYTKPEEECIAPKKLVADRIEDLEVDTSSWLIQEKMLISRIESLEIANESLSLERRATDELLVEIKRRVG